MRPLISGEIEVEGCRERGRAGTSTARAFTVCRHLPYLFHSVVPSLEGQCHHFHFAYRETEAQSYGNLPNN